MVARLAVMTLVACCAILPSSEVNASPNVEESSIDSAHAVHLVVDLSGSMNDSDGNGRVKIEGAKSALLQFLDGVPDGLAVGLRTYPGGGGWGCDDGELRFPPDTGNVDSVSKEILALQASGTTPTAEALRAAADDVQGFSATIILVSDGESDCGDPCLAASEIAAEGVDLDVITVGFEISSQGKEELECIANKLDGTYIDVTEAADIAEEIKKLLEPKLSLKIEHVSEVIAEDGVVSVTATVQNIGLSMADNVKVLLRFDTPSPGVYRPVRLLGNLEPGKTKEETWQFRPGLLLADTTAEFSVHVTAKYLDESIDESGSVLIKNPVAAEDAGELLKGKRLAILGDSYSSGEGADVYVDGTDNSENSCHRSRLTYAANTFDDVLIFACSGAVAIDLFTENVKNNVDSQINQLSQAQLGRSGPFDAVLMTIGGNDAKFSTIAKACLLGSCSEEIEGESSDEFRNNVLEDLSTSLIDAYGFVHGALNSPDAVQARGGKVAPIVVLGYPIPVPTVKRSCNLLMGETNDSIRSLLSIPLEVASAINLIPPELARRVDNFSFSSDEVKWLMEFTTDLNGTIEGAVKSARDDYEIPVVYVPNTEQSFLPDHTACDTKPYARGLLSLNGADINLSASLLDFGYLDTKDWFSRSTNELLHPNQDGFKAMSAALIRWSHTDDADIDLDDFGSAVPEPTCTVTWGEPSNPTIYPDQVWLKCKHYELKAEGFAPYERVYLEANSVRRSLGYFDADENGNVDMNFVLPITLEPGDHVLRVNGYDENYEPKEVVYEFRIEPETDGPPLSIGVAAAALILVSGIIVATGIRRRRIDEPNIGS